MHLDDSRDLEALRAEVSELRSELGAIRSDRPARTSPGLPRLHRLRRSTAVLGLVGLLIALPMVVSASDSFTDVPDSNTFHDNINALYGARVTTGCAAGKYCPNDPVTRGSMSAFLNRSLGRAAGTANLVDTGWADLTGDVASATLRVGGATGGTASVLVQADLSYWTDENGLCPCELEVFLWNSATPETSITIYSAVVNEQQLSTFRDGTASVSHLFSVPSGVQVTFNMNAVVTTTLSPSPENIAGYAYSMTALYVPFGADGDAVAPIVTSGSGGSRKTR